MQHKTLWVFGDSYTTPHELVKPWDSFWGLFAEKVSADTISNCSRRKNSFDSVCQLLIAQQSKYNWAQDVFLIGIPPLSRVTIFDNFENTAYTGTNITTNNWTETQFDISAHRGLVCKHFGELGYTISYEDRSWTEAQALRQVFLLTQWLDAMGANYLVLNLSEPMMADNQWGPTTFAIDYCKKHPRCVIFDDTYYSINFNLHRPPDYDIWGWHGHHDARGNLNYFENSVWPKFEKITNT